MGFLLAHEINSNWNFSGTYSGGVAPGWGATITSPASVFSNTSFYQRGQYSQGYTATSASPVANILFVQSLINAIQSQAYRIQYGVRINSGGIRFKILDSVERINTTITSPGWNYIINSIIPNTNYLEVQFETMSLNYNMGFIDFCRIEEQVELFPEYDIMKADPSDRVILRSKSGKNYRYVFNTIRKWEFTARWTPLADANMVNSWWQGNYDALAWYETMSYDTYPSSFHEISIIADEKPYQEWETPYWNQKMKGDLILETNSAI